MVSLHSLTVSASDIESCDHGRSQLALGLDCHLQHLHIGLTFQHLSHADVLGRDGCNYHIRLLVALGRDSEIRTRIAALTYIFQRDRAIDDDRTEWFRCTSIIHQQFLVVHFRALINIEVCRVGKADVLTSQQNAFGLASRRQCEDGLHAVGTIAFGTAVIKDGNRLAQSQSQCAVIALGHQHLILQCASAIGVTLSGGQVGRTDVHTDETGIDGGVLLSIGIDVGLHGEEVIALSECDGLVEGDGHFSGGSGLTQFGVVLPYADLGHAGLGILQVQLHRSECKRIQATLGLHIDGEQVLIGSTDRGIGRAGLCSLHGSHLHIFRQILADGGLETCGRRVGVVRIEADGQCAIGRGRTDNAAWAVAVVSRSGWFPQHFARGALSVVNLELGT